MVYLITYDLNEPGQNYDKIIQAIKDVSVCSYSYWKSSYLIKSHLKTANEVFSKIKPYLDVNDRAFVAEVNNNKQGWLTKEQWDFINNSIFN